MGRENSVVCVGNSDIIFHSFYDEFLKCLLLTIPRDHLCIKKRVTDKFSIVGCSDDNNNTTKGANHLIINPGAFSS